MSSDYRGMKYREVKYLAKSMQSGRSPGERNGTPLQYSCLRNPMDRGAWWATVHRITELDMTEHLSMHTHTHTHRSLI